MDFRGEYRTNTYYVYISYGKLHNIAHHLLPTTTSTTDYMLRKWTLTTRTTEEETPAPATGEAAGATASMVRTAALEGGRRTAAAAMAAARAPTSGRARSLPSVPRGTHIPAAFPQDPAACCSQQRPRRPPTSSSYMHTRGVLTNYCRYKRETREGAVFVAAHPRPHNVI